MIDPPQRSTSRREDSGYEQQDVNIGKIAFWAMVSLLILVILVVLTNEFFLATKESLVTETVLRPESIPLRELRARETEILTSYGVIDAQAGVYRIPIEEAVQRMAEEAYEKP